MTVVRNFYRFRRENDGVAAVEFALIAPTLLLLLIGMYDFGNFLNKQMRLENAARAAAEYVNQGGSVDDLETDIVQLANFDVDDASLTTLDLQTEFVCECSGGEVIDCDTETCTADDTDTDTYIRRYFNVNMNMTVNTLFPYPGLPDNVPLSGTARIQVQ